MSQTLAQLIKGVSLASAPAGALTVDSSGRLGIGTSTPATVVDIEASADAYITIQPGTTDGNVGLLINNSAGTQKGVILYDTDDNYMLLSTENTERMRITSGGNVGIGTASPGALLHAAGKIRFGSNATYYGEINHDAASTGSNIYNSQDNGGHIFQVSGSEKARLTGSGQWLVGTSTAPDSYAGLSSQKLTVASTSYPASSLAVINYQNDTIGGGLNLAHSRNTTVGSQTIVQSGDTVGIIRFSGSDGSAMRAAAIIKADVDTHPGANDMPGRLMFMTTANGTSSPVERMRIDNAGWSIFGSSGSQSSASGIGVKINGTNGGVYAVGTVGDTYNFYNTTASAYRFYVTNAGVINATSTTITAISDNRLKENIVDIDKGLTEILQLQPRKFDWKEGKGKNIKNDRGFIAQEFEKVFPDLVTTWKDPAPEGEEPYKAVSADLIPVLVKAIQEQQAIIQSLEARLSALETQ